ncbi:MAG: hypothetical protein HRU22_12925 [Gammaproteobacteria bacterium]|nr:hypothetical protein [Gammaproteobacteria bacterium]
MRRKFLKHSVLLMLCVGIVLISLAFIQSLTPSEKARSVRSEHDISTLNNGEYRFDVFGRENLWAQKVLLLKTNAGELFVYVLPSNEEGIPLPEHWWGFGNNMHLCKDFRPTITIDGNIKCHDIDMPDWGKDAWIWDLNGKSRTFWVADLMSPSIEIRNQTVYINL